jgi:hypothetical protein
MRRIVLRTGFRAAARARAGDHRRLSSVYQTHAPPPSFLQFAARPFLFASGVTAAAFSGAGLVRYERHARERRRRIASVTPRDRFGRRVSARSGSGAARATWSFPRAMHDAHPMLSSILVSLTYYFSIYCMTEYSSNLMINILHRSGWSALPTALRSSRSAR